MTVSYTSLLVWQCSFIQQIRYTVTISTNKKRIPMLIYRNAAF